MHPTSNAADTGTPLLEVADLSVTFASEAGPVTAVRSLSYTVERGEVLGIVGESGSGKSVSSLAVMGLLPPHARVAGSVRFRGTELTGQSDKDLSTVRGRKVAMIFQDPLSALTPVYTVGDQIAEALLVHESFGREAARARAVELLEMVGIPNPRQRASAFPHEFSGGMRQRAMIAMAIANNPEVIIADEPTTALDVTIQAQILQVLKAAQEVTGAAIILITHDMGVIAGVADRVGVMYAGKLVELGAVDDVFYRARMPYTLGLLGSIPRLDAGAHQMLTPIEGNPPSLVDLPRGCPFTPRCPLRVRSVHRHGAGTRHHGLVRRAPLGSLPPQRRCRTRGDDEHRCFPHASAAAPGSGSRQARRARRRPGGSRSRQGVSDPQRLHPASARRHRATRWTASASTSARARRSDSLENPAAARPRRSPNFLTWCGRCRGAS